MRLFRLQELCARAPNALPRDGRGHVARVRNRAIREVEIHHNGRLSPGLHSYGGWFHVVGSVEQGNDARRQVAENAWTYDLAPVTTRFAWGVTTDLALVASPFEGRPSSWRRRPRG